MMEKRIIVNLENQKKIEQKDQVILILKIFNSFIAKWDNYLDGVEPQIGKKVKK